MKRLMSIILSLILASQSVLVYAQAGGTSAIDDKDYSFFGIPRDTREYVETKSDCKFNFKSRRYCEKFIAKGAENFDYYKVVMAKLVNCSAIYGVKGKKKPDIYKGDHPMDKCVLYERYGTKREQAWQAYLDAKQLRGEYWKLSPAELYKKYDDVAQDIKHLWNENPDYKAHKASNFMDNMIVTAIIIVILVNTGDILGPKLAEKGLNISAGFSSFKPLETVKRATKVLSTADKGLVLNALGAVKGAVTSGIFWADIGVTVAYLFTDIVFTLGAFYAMQSLSDDFKSLREDVTYLDNVKRRNLLVETVDFIKAEQEKAIQNSDDKKTDEDIVAENKALKEEVIKSLEGADWGQTRQQVIDNAVFDLYALEYLRAEMADLSDYHRYREAVIDFMSIYFPDKMENIEKLKKRHLIIRLEEDRKSLYDDVKKAHDAKELAYLQSKERAWAETLMIAP